MLLGIMENVIRRTGVSAEQLNRECKTKDFDELSDITVKYRRYGFLLDLSEPEVEKIERDPNLLHSAKEEVKLKPSHYAPKKGGKL